jgi:hypothetical protein
MKNSGCRKLWVGMATTCLALAFARPGRTQVEAVPEPVVDCSDTAKLQAITGLFPPASVQVRTESLEHLAACHAAETAGPVAAVIHLDREATVRASAAKTLGAIGGRSAIDSLRATAGYSREASLVRQAAVTALATLEAWDALAALTKDASAPSAERWSAMQYLQKAPTSVAAAPPEAVPSEAQPAIEIAPPVPPLPAATVVATQPSHIPTPDKTSPPLPVPESKPAAPPDGTALVVATSTLAGGYWGANLALLAGQNSTGVVTLVGSAGAVIGGGTALGLTRFGLRPSPAQALWYANATTWGTLAGLAARSAASSVGPKLQYGLLISGETIGVAAGLWGASQFGFTTGDVVLANAIVGAAGLAGLGTRLVLDPSAYPTPNTWTAAAVVPVMVASTYAAKKLRLTESDRHLALAAAIGTGATTRWLATGLSDTEDPNEQKRVAVGGTLMGIGGGFIGALALSPFVEPSDRKIMAHLGGLAAGNLFGLGLHMVVAPEDSQHWGLGAGLGGVGFAATGLLLAPHLKLQANRNAFAMATFGGVTTASTWALALSAASTGQPADARVPGGMLAGAIAGGSVGLLASPHFHPDGMDHLTAGAGVATGMATGLGVARLVDSEKGSADFYGVVGGAGVGFAGSALFAHHKRLRGPDVSAAILGGSVGALAGSILPTLQLSTRDPDGSHARALSGGTLVGLGLGATGGALFSNATQASPATLKLLWMATPIAIGTGMGLGKMIDPTDETRAARIGTLAGIGIGTGGALLANRLIPQLRLAEPLHGQAVTMGLHGAAMGWFVSSLALDFAPFGDGYAHSDQQREGARLMGASAGLGTGLILSRFADPSGQDHLVATAGSLYGLSLGDGIANLSWRSDPPDTPDSRGAMLRVSGALVGLGAGAWVAHAVDLRGPDEAAILLGTGYGALMGALVPSLDENDFKGTRTQGGSSEIGLTLGAVGAGAASYVTGANAGQIRVTTGGAILGMGFGGGLGQWLTDSGSQGARIGVVAGSAGGIGASLLLDSQLKLSSGLPDAATGLALFGGLLGATEGWMLAGATSKTGALDGGTGRANGSAQLAGVSLGIASGLVLSRFIEPTGQDYLVGATGWGLGAMMGAGAATLAFDDKPRATAVGTMVGSAAGMTAAFATQAISPIESTDVGAAFVGAAAGGIVGWLAPTLHETDADLGSTRSGAGFELGLPLGVASAIALRKWRDTDSADTTLVALAGFDGAMMGYGVGRLYDGDDNQGRRIGVVAGTGAGLAVGGLLWTRLTLEDGDPLLIAGLTGMGAWTGLLAPRLGKADANDVNDHAPGAMLLVGGGLGSFGAVALAHKLNVSSDLMKNAFGLYITAQGAGAGLGALVSERDDAPIWGLMGGGAFGLLAGGVLHDRISYDETSQPLLTAATIEGLWMGSWLPHAIHDDPSDAQQVGGIGLGALGAFTLGSIASSSWHPNGAQTGTAVLGSTFGAAISGGSALLASDLEGRERVQILLGGTTVGLVGGALLTPHLEIDSRAASHASIGAALGASEGMLFAWSGRADSSRSYAGAALVGAGLGGTLGLAHAASPNFTSKRGFAAAGFAAWGSWMGAFSGAYFNRDAHDVTLGAMLGTNVGLAAGYGLMHTDLVQPRDFGWLSLGAAIGTVVAGGGGAFASTREDPRPVLGGLAAGPVLGMLGGALLLPKLRTLGGSNSNANVSRTFAVNDSGNDDANGEPDPRRLTDRTRSNAARGMNRAFDLQHLMPMVGSLPPTPDTPGPAPLLFGVTGLWN